MSGPRGKEWSRFGILSRLSENMVAVPLKTTKQMAKQWQIGQTTWPFRNLFFSLGGGRAFGAFREFAGPVVFLHTQEPRLKATRASCVHMAVGQNQWYPSGVGEFTTHVRTYFSGWTG